MWRIVFFNDLESYVIVKIMQITMENQ